jgi:hypothetical protein
MYTSRAGKLFCNSRCRRRSSSSVGCPAGGALQSVERATERGAPAQVGGAETTSKQKKKNIHLYFFLCVFLNAQIVSVLFIRAFGSFLHGPSSFFENGVCCVSSLFICVFLLKKALATQKFREQQEEERRRRMEEQRLRDLERRTQVEERKKAILEAERERREAMLRRSEDRGIRQETKRRNERGSIAFAFGSSTPRMLEPVDSCSSYWGSRR